MYEWNERLSCRVIINHVFRVTRVHLQNHLNNQAFILIIGDLVISSICQLRITVIIKFILLPILTVYHTYVISFLRNCHNLVTV